MLCVVNTLQTIYLLFCFQKVHVEVSQKERMKQELVTALEETEAVLVIFDPIEKESRAPLCCI